MLKRASRDSAPAARNGNDWMWPTLTLNPQDDLTVTTGWLFFWRHRMDDGIYTTSGTLLRSAEGTRSRFVGHSPGVEAIWQVKSYLSLTGNASMFTAGPFIRNLDLPVRSAFSPGG